MLLGKQGQFLQLEALQVGEALRNLESGLPLHDYVYRVQLQLLVALVVQGVHGPWFDKLHYTRVPVEVRRHLQRKPCLTFICG